MNWGRRRMSAGGAEELERAADFAVDGANDGGDRRGEGSWSRMRDVEPL